MKPMHRGIGLLLTLALILVLPACSGQPVGGVLTADTVGSRSSGVKNTLVITADGSAQDYGVEAPAGVVASHDGVENYGAVPLGTASVTLPDGTQLLATVPNDFGVDSVSITHPDGSVVTLDGVSVSTSAVVTARASFVNAMAPVLATLSDAQLRALEAQYAAQAALGDSFAQAIVPLIRTMLGAP